MTIGDITRSSFDPDRHYSSVRMQQGRVQLDADWNEQLDIQLHRDRSDVIDTIGVAAAPKQGGGFGLTVSLDGTDLLIEPGRMWVGGHPCELGASSTAATVSGADVAVESLVLDGTQIAVHSWVLLTGGDGSVDIERVSAIDVTTRHLTLSAAPPALAVPVTMQLVRSYVDQPDLPGPDLTTAATPAVPGALDLPAGTYLAYLDVWTRGLTAVEAPGIVEPALGGPDTTTRNHTVWQVKLLALAGAPAGLDASSDLSQWTVALAPPTGTMAARAEPDTATANLCTPTPAGGFTGLENQLYRVQVHSVGGDGRPNFLWSRENASVVTAWTDTIGDKLTVGGIGRDAVLGFAGDQLVELLDDGRELSARPGTLVRLLKAEGTTLHIDPTTADGSVDHDDFGTGSAKVRRWDCDALVTADLDTWIELEDGVQVEFSQGTYRPGDHWLVPARPAIADVDWPVDSGGAPLLRPPAAVEHSWAPLALVDATGAAVSTIDVRRRFPSLSTLTATDVGFDDAVCAMPGVVNVQQALDQLCRQHDLRRHHRLLHGWGIVCGLQVHCGPDDPNTPGCQNVTVLPGTAIDAEGNDLDLVDPLEIDLVQRVKALSQTVPDVLDAGGNGEVCLLLEGDAQGGLDVGIEPLDAQADEVPGILQGTLLLDFYNDCIKSLHDWLRDELSRPPDDTSPVSPAQERVDALINLITQSVNGKSGANIFLSPREDEILQSFYKGLRERLQSETFCAMFDTARTPPAYPAGLDGLDTIFGLGGHTRLRVRPDGKEAYTVGAGLSLTSPTPLIHRYDLDTGRMVSRIDPVAGKEVVGRDKPDPGTNAATDIAFSPDSKLIYVIVPTHGEDDTLFRVGEIGDGTIRWRPGVVICGVKLVTLAVTRADPSRVYAVGQRKVTVTNNNKTTIEWHGAGLYAINIDAPDPNTQPMPLGIFPVGHLQITDAGTAIVSSADSDRAITSSQFEMVYVINLPAGTFVSTLAVQGIDDVVLAGPDPASPRIFAVVKMPTGSGKGIVGMDLFGNSINAGQVIPLQQSNGMVQLVGFRDRLGATSADEYLMRVIDIPSATVVPGIVIPLQVAPVSAALGTKRAYALNYLSNTISVIDQSVFERTPGPDLAALAAYRKAMVEAYGDLLAGFIQYLKDGFFDHFLVRCPQPTGNEKLYLACASIRGGNVYKVCNFSRRKYVKSFPTIGYWLSAIPLLPFAKEWLAKIACSVLPEFMSRLSVNDSSDSADRFSAQQIQQLLNWVQSADLLGKVRNVRGSASTAAGAAMFAAARAQTQAPPPSAPRVVGREIIDQPTEQITQRLEGQGLAVVRQPFVPSVGLTAPANIGQLLRSASPGDEVTLYEDQGVVRYYKVSARAVVDPALAATHPSAVRAATAPDVTTADLAIRITALERELATLRTAPATTAAVPTKKATVAKKAVPAKKATPTKKATAATGRAAKKAPAAKAATKSAGRRR